MSNYDQLPTPIQELYREGLEYRKRLSDILDEWPNGEYSKRIEYIHRADCDKQKISEALLDVERWINALGVHILPRTVHDKKKLKNILTALKRVVLEEEYKEVSTEEANKLVDEALSFVLSFPLPRGKSQVNLRDQQTSLIPNTAFIIMPMCKSRAYLDDVCDAIKEVFSRFNIHAFRADDIPHQEKITDMVLQYIANSEFLIADLTWERPNVYYEVGYAHALNKRPILYRKRGTELHFNLSVHNVPEYKNLADLKRLLHIRLEAILGRKIA